MKKCYSLTMKDVTPKQNSLVCISVIPSHSCCLYFVDFHRCDFPISNTRHERTSIWERTGKMAGETSCGGVLVFKHFVALPTRQHFPLLPFFNTSDRYQIYVRMCLLLKQQGAHTRDDWSVSNEQLRIRLTDNFPDPLQNAMDLRAGSSLGVQPFLRHRLVSASSQGPFTTISNLNGDLNS